MCEGPGLQRFTQLLFPDIKGATCSYFHTYYIFVKYSFATVWQKDNHFLRGFRSASLCKANKHLEIMIGFLASRFTSDRVTSHVMATLLSDNLHE